MTSPVALARSATSTTDPPGVSSPRASGHLMHAAQGRAAAQGRDFVIPEDVREIATAALRHRLILAPEARMEEKRPVDVVKDVLEAIPLPTGIS